MDRKHFVKAAAIAGGAFAVGQGAHAQVEANRVPMEVQVDPAWLTWASAASACLRALGEDCDNVDVAGVSGYAFHMCITDVVGVEGPTVLPWDELAVGCRYLGRSTLGYSMGPWGEEEHWDAAERECLALAKREVDAGRPCVLWGTGIPEFGVVVGYDGEEFIYRWSAKPNEDQRVKCRELSDPGGAYLLMFPTAVQVRDGWRDPHAVSNALNFLRRRSGDPGDHFGLKAYDVWIEALQAKRAAGFGNNYCAQCFSEGKGFAREFVQRLADRNDAVAGPLDEAVMAYQTCADAMRMVAQLFPFPNEDERVEDPITIDDACEELAIARDAEGEAAEALQKALDMWPRDHL